MPNTEQTPAQRMAEIIVRAREAYATRDDVAWMIDRCRKLEKIAEAVSPLARDWANYLHECGVAERTVVLMLREAGYDN